MGKKKKKIEDDAWLWMSQPVVPGIIPVQSSLPTIIAEKIVKLVDRSRTTDWDEAFMYYTFEGPTELLAGKSGVQAAAASRLGFYGGSLLTALKWELSLDFAIFGAILTVFDPAHKWKGGLDESGVLQAQRTLPVGHVPFQTGDFKHPRSGYA